MLELTDQERHELVEELNAITAALNEHSRSFIQRLDALERIARELVAKREAQR